MFWNVFVVPIVFSAGILQRFLGSPQERETQTWETRLHFGDFLFGLLAILAAGGVALFAVIAWSGSGQMETKYAVHAADALQSRNFAEAVVACQRLVDMRPQDRKYRYYLAQAHAGLGETERALGLMYTLAPADGNGYPQAQLWVAERMLFNLQPNDEAGLRDVESRLIRLRSVPDVGPAATVLLVRLYFLTGRGAYVLNEPALRAAAESVPELHLSLLQAGVGRVPQAVLQKGAGELREYFVDKLRDAPSDLATRRSAIGAEILLGNFPAATQLLRDGLTLHPTDADLQRLWGAAAVAQAQAVQLSAASPELKQRLAQDAVHALELRPQQDDAYQLRLAQMLRLSGNTAESERRYRLAADKLPIARLELGELLAATDRSDEAAAEFEKLLAHHQTLPQSERDSPENVILSSAALSRLKRWDEAVQRLGPLATQIAEAKVLLLQTHLAVADAADNDPPKRLAALQAALKLEPFFQPALQRLLQPLGNEETNVAARKMIVDLAADGDAPASAYLLLGTDALLHKDTVTAEKYFELALRSAPQSPIILNNLAWSLAFGPKADLERALSLVQTADRIAPNNAQIQDTHGRILAKLGRWKDALLQFQACAKTYDGRADHHRALAEVYAKLALPELAKRHQERAVEITRREQASAVPTASDALPTTEAGIAPMPPN